MNTNLVIVPTYNEALNIDVLVERLIPLLATCDILFVDDTSPDGTGAKIKTYVDKHPSIHLMMRAKKDGLAGAYIAGFAWGLERNYQNFIQMDADLSHDPLVIPTFLEILRSAEGAIGCRYMNGGGTLGWARHRQLLSRAGNWYARSVLGVTYLDMTGGFNAWSRKALELINIKELRCRGYAYQVELKIRAHRKGLKLVETPISFHERKFGVSKMSTDIILEAAYRVWTLRK